MHTIDSANDPVLPPAPARVHFIGIGGISMSGLAVMLLDAGYEITGSDATESSTVADLRARGVQVVIGHADPALAGAAHVVVSTRRAELQAAVELEAARRHDALIVKRGQLLGMIANPLQSLAVAGTHGKSTTSGMLAIGLLALGREPAYAVGAKLPGLEGNTASGSGGNMVVEADEFDRSFLWLRPNVSIITSVSFDHPDIYADQDDYDSAFVTFARQTKPGGTLVIAADDPGSQRVLAALAVDATLPFSIATFGETDEADWRLERSGDAWRFLAPGGVAVEARLGVPGAHNARNAIAAVAAMHAVGVEPREAATAVETFTGVGRRFEHKGTIAGIDVVDDYAHHPEEIAAVVAAARMRFPGRRVYVVHQPHTYTRTRALLHGFATALDLADQVLLLDIYPGGELDDLGISSDDLKNLLHVPVQTVNGPDQAAATVARDVRPGDVVLTLGAGDITRTGDLVLQRLADKASPPPRPVPSRHREPTITIPEAPGLKVMRDASMSMFTTMRLGGPADVLVRAPTPDDIVAAMRWASGEGLPVTVIGGGSNLLVGDDGIRGLVIVARTPGERASGLLNVEDGGARVRLTVGAQAPLSWVGRHCAEHGWAGMDWGVGLPGQIGGATVNNAGAHGTELKDHLLAIDVLHVSGEVERLPASWLEPAYRMTRIKAGSRPRPWIVLRAVFELPKHDPAELVALADDHAAFRKRTQPTGACSGSTFANPDGDFAGRLLEAADLKGFRLGAMQLSPKHANWVVNTGGGSAADAWALIRQAQDTVHERFGVRLRPEIERLGEPWPEDAV
jgi:UDP-N-acetylmuramate--alanine ligase